MSLFNIMFRSNRTFCFSQNQTTYSVAFLVTAWLVIVEGFDQADNNEKEEHLMCVLSEFEESYDIGNSN